MNKPYLLFAVKCAVILYFTAFTGINSTGNSATPVLTKGTCIVSLQKTAREEQANDLFRYGVIFRTSGEINAVVNGEEINGNWSEDDILKKININLGNSNPLLARLNGYWNIKYISNTNIILAHNDNSDPVFLNIASL